ncbi:MAG: hypothetical protein ACOC7J_06095 [Armatimonadota bacterium]
MARQPWLQLDDELLLDDVDYRVVATLVAHTDRLRFQRVALVGELRGERRMVLQTEDEIMEAREIAAEALSGEKVELRERAFRLRWDSDVRTERAAPDASPKFGRGRCAWYVADDGAVAVLIVERYERVAIEGEPLEGARIDLRFTVGLREGRA